MEINWKVEQKEVKSKDHYIRNYTRFTASFSVDSELVDERGRRIGAVGSILWIRWPDSKCPPTADRAYYVQVQAARNGRGYGASFNHCGHFATHHEAQLYAVEHVEQILAGYRKRGGSAKQIAARKAAKKVAVVAGEPNLIEQ
jgi:hypothetical protein